MPVDEPNSSLDHLVDSAIRFEAQGRLGDAEAFARRAVVDSPKHIAARQVLGVVLAKQLKLAEARAFLEDVAREDASSYPSRLWLSRIARKNGRAQESMDYAGQALALEPENPEALINFGLAAIDARDDGSAVEALRRAATITPNAAGVFLHLGIAEQHLGHLQDAFGAFSRALAIDSRLADAHLGIGQVLLAAGNPIGAGAAASQTLALSPKSILAHELLIEALVKTNRGVEAEDQARRFTAANPDNSTGYCLLGKCLLSLGKSEDAVEALQESLALQPAQGTAYCLIAQSEKITPIDISLVSGMERTLAGGGLSPREESYLRYGLGKAYEDLERYAEAMARFDEANRLAYEQKFGSGVFNRTAYAAQVQHTIGAFDVGFPGRHAEIGNPSETPIFIVGMIRSGTTLVEQILSRHPEVTAGGEQAFWQARWTEAFSAESGEFQPKVLGELGEGYLGVLRALDAGRPRVTDKLPGNYARLGLLHAAFPRARIIHVRRDPLDTCISIYATPNAAPNEFAHDRGNIVFGYREYLRLMEHWRGVLPSGAMLEVDYETLVTDRQAVSQSIVEFCGLEWSDLCLTPEDSQRAISTPSALQARKPVYSSSIGRWRRYEGLLGEFKDLA